MSIQNEITRITNARDASFVSIGSKGVTVPSGSTMDDMASLIDDIDAVKTLASVPSTKDSSIIIVNGEYYLWRS